MSNHTPAPWYARQVHVDGFITHVVSLDADPVEDEYHYGRNIAKDLSGNNAALIAAAPELLAACEAMRRTEHLSGVDRRAFEESFDETMILINKAIRKAHGEK